MKLVCSSLILCDFLPTDATRSGPIGHQTSASDSRSVRPGAAPGSKKIRTPFSWRYSVELVAQRVPSKVEHEFDGSDVGSTEVKGILILKTEICYFFEANKCLVNKERYGKKNNFQ